MKTYTYSGHAKRSLRQPIERARKAGIVVQEVQLGAGAAAAGEGAIKAGGVLVHQQEVHKGAAAGGGEVRKATNIVVQELHLGTAGGQSGTGAVGGQGEPPPVQGMARRRAESMRSSDKHTVECHVCCRHCGEGRPAVPPTAGGTGNTCVLGCDAGLAGSSSKSSNSASDRAAKTGATVFRAAAEVPVVCCLANRAAVFSLKDPGLLVGMLATSSDKSSGTCTLHSPAPVGSSSSNSHRPAPVGCDHGAQLQRQQQLAAELRAVSEDWFKGRGLSARTGWFLNRQALYEGEHEGR